MPGLRRRTIAHQWRSKPHLSLLLVVSYLWIPSSVKFKARWPGVSLICKRKGRVDLWRADPCLYSSIGSRAISPREKIDLPSISPGYPLSRRKRASGQQVRYPRSPTKAPGETAELDPNILYSKRSHLDEWIRRIAFRRPSWSYFET